MTRREWAARFRNLDPEVVALVWDAWNRSAWDVRATLLAAMDRMEGAVDLDLHHARLGGGR